MGQVEVKYKAGRGQNAEGEIVDDPKDWFELVLREDFEDFKARYDAAPVEVQEAITEVFGEVFYDAGDAAIWLDGNIRDQ